MVNGGTISAQAARRLLPVFVEAAKISFGAERLFVSASPGRLSSPSSTAEWQGSGPERNADAAYGELCSEAQAAHQGKSRCPFPIHRDIFLAGSTGVSCALFCWHCR